MNRILESYLVFGIKNSSWVIKKCSSWAGFKVYNRNFACTALSTSKQNKKSNQSLNNLVRSSKLDSWSEIDLLQEQRSQVWNSGTPELHISLMNLFHQPYTIWPKRTVAKVIPFKTCEYFIKIYYVYQNANQNEGSLNLW